MHTSCNHHHLHSSINIHYYLFAGVCVCSTSTYVFFFCVYTLNPRIFPDSVRCSHDVRALANTRKPVSMSARARERDLNHCASYTAPTHTHTNTDKIMVRTHTHIRIVPGLEGGRAAASAREKKTLTMRRSSIRRLCSCSMVLQTTTEATVAA